MAETKKSEKHVGVVLWLEDEYNEQIKALYKAYDEAHGLSLSSSLINPHVSLAVGTDFDIEKMSSICEQLVAEFKGRPVALRAYGFAVFPPLYDQNTCVLYTPVARTPNLAALNVRCHELIEATPGALEGNIAYYTPQNWQPHITLAMGKGVSLDLLPQLIQPLLQKKNNIQFTSKVTHISLFDDALSKQHVYRKDFALV